MSTSSSMFTHLLTKQKLVAIFFVQLNEAYQITVLLPMVVFMCRDFGIDPKWLGIYSSLLNASFGICQFLVAYLWGYLSDKYGRRIIIIIGLVGTTMFMLLFGISSSFPMAMIARCLTGFANGNLGVIKAYLADITDSHNRGPAFGIIGCAFGAGTILGSLLGGILLNTNDVNDENYEKTTSVLKFWIFEKQYPYLLPCVCGAMISGLSLLLTAIYVIDYDRTKDIAHDTKQIFIPNICSIGKASAIGQNLSFISTETDVDVELSSALSDGFLRISRNSYSQKMNKKLFCNGNENEINDGEENDEQEGYMHIDAQHQSLPTHQEFKALIASFNPEKGGLLSHKQSLQINSLRDLFEHTLLIHGLIQYGIICLAHMMFKEMLPVYMAQALLFDSTMIGYSQAFSGFSIFIYILFCLGPMLRKYQHKRLLISCALQTMFLYAVMPTIYWLIPISKLPAFSDAKYLGNVYVALSLAMLLEGMFTPAINTIFVIDTCYVNNSVPFEHIGKANGIGQTVASFVRGVGPIITGFIWSESIDQIQNHSTHYAIYYAFLPCILLMGFGVVHAVFKVPVDLQFTWEQRIKDSKTIESD